MTFTTLTVSALGLTIDLRCSNARQLYVLAGYSHDRELWEIRTGTAAMGGGTAANRHVANA